MTSLVGGQMVKWQWTGILYLSEQCICLWPSHPDFWHIAMDTPAYIWNNRHPGWIIESLFILVKDRQQHLHGLLHEPGHVHHRTSGGSKREAPFGLRTHQQDTMLSEKYKVLLFIKRRKIRIYIFYFFSYNETLEGHNILLPLLPPPPNTRVHSGWVQGEQEDFPVQPFPAFSLCSQTTKVNF